MDCERHPGQEAIGRCLECGKGICSQCVTETSQVLVCPECFQKEVDRIASAMGTAPGEAPKTRKERPPKAGKPKKGELPVAVEPPPAFVQSHPVTPLLDAMPSEVQQPPAEAPPVYAPPVETAAAPPEVPTWPPAEQVPVEPKGKARKEKPPRVKKEKPPKEKRKKGEAPVAPDVALPPLVPGMEVSPLEGAPPGESGVSEKPKGKAKKQKPPKARKEKPPVVKKQKPPRARTAKKGETKVPPPVFMPPPTGVPFEEAPVEEAPPMGFDEGEGMMEKVRPEHVTGEDYLPSPEHQEVMGEPWRDVVVPGEDTGGAVPVEQISDVTVLGEEAEVPKEDRPVEEAPAPGTLEKPTPPPPAPPPFEGPTQAGPAAGEEEQGVEVDESGPREQPPGRRVGAEEELNSFFFKDEIDKKEKDPKGDDETFWE